MAATVPPIPFKTPMLNAQGFLSQPWSQWLVFLFQRVGGNSDTLPGDVGTEIATLQSQVATLQEQVSGLNQGKTL